MDTELYYQVLISAEGASYDLSTDLASLSIEEDTSQPSMLMISVDDPYKALSHALQEGMDIQVDIGTIDDHSIIFMGSIYKVQAEFPQDGIPRLRLLAHDESMKMGLRKRNRAWVDMTLEAIVQEIAQEYFVAPNIEVRLKGNPDYSGNGIRQQNETDLAFLHRMANTYGCKLFVESTEEGEYFRFLSQQSIMDSEPLIALYHGRAKTSYRLLSFEASSDISNIQLPRVFAGINYESGEITEIVSSEIESMEQTEDTFFDENLTEFYRDDPVRAEKLQTLLAASSVAREALGTELGEAELQAVSVFTTDEALGVQAENQFSTNLLGMRAEGRAVGNQRIRALSTVDIGDVGGRFSGVWFLSQVRHVLNGDGYYTEFQCQR